MIPYHWMKLINMIIKSDNSMNIMKNTNEYKYFPNSKLKTFGHQDWQNDFIAYKKPFIMRFFII